MIQNIEYREVQNFVLGKNDHVNLNELPYWPFRTVFPICTQKKGLIPIGTFYLPFNTISDFEFKIIEKNISNLSSEEIIFIPHIRKNDEETLQKLRELGFYLIDVEGESIVKYIGIDSDEYLREKIGSKRFREHNRIVRKSQEYIVMTYTLEEVLHDFTLFEGWSNLFNIHEKKYNNSISVYGSDFLNKFSILKNYGEYQFNFRFSGDQIIQVYLTRITSDTLYLIAAASHPHYLENGINLYTTLMMDNIKEKNRLNIEFLHLGRGGKERKLMYGANVYIPHIHAIYTKSQDVSHEIDNG
ncbi:hypothetical protein [Xenorhabdus bovienii]|uniref:hypothetical protein n=1 Tax=Xenorhabdus bovienii TaxID=40576 RepID=UPI0023B2C2F8|nr:hypothetical protein [Xenorhabdus bovienii]MDE9461174.1 hypothetical protein [Xenorhabdus bovienii]MDE9469479.1 hypothetical protein [Xenorhabdus bovienii]